MSSQTFSKCLSIAKAEVARIERWTSKALCDYSPAECIVHVNQQGWTIDTLYRFPVERAYEAARFAYEREYKYRPDLSSGNIHVYERGTDELKLQLRIEFVPQAWFDNVRESQDD